MKKLLSLLGAIGLVATSSATVVSCDNGDKDSSNAGDFSTDLSKVAGDTTALEEAIKTQFEDTDKIADAEFMFFDTIDNANNAEDVMTAGKGDTTMPGNITKIKGDEKSVAFYAYIAPAKEGEFGTTVLKGTITNKPEEKTGITLDNTEVSIAIGGTDTVAISNIDDLTNVKAESADAKIATAELADSTITIKGVAEGSTTITVSAEGVDPVTINVTVKAADEKTTISLDNTEVSIAIGGTDTVAISNIDDLTNVKAESADAKIATAELADGTITIKGVAEGSTTITVSAEGVDPVTINVTVAAA
jgi:ribosomal protein L32E